MPRFVADPNRAEFLAEELRKCFQTYTWYLSEGRNEHFGLLKSVECDSRGLRLRIADPNHKQRLIDVVWRCSYGVAAQVLEKLTANEFSGAPAGYNIVKEAVLDRSRAAGRFEVATHKGVAQ